MRSNRGFYLYLFFFSIFSLICGLGQIFGHGIIWNHLQVVHPFIARLYGFGLVALGVYGIRSSSRALFKEGHWGK